MRSIKRWAVLCVILIWNSHLYSQGPLTPPGAPTPLFKTLSQIESRIPIGPDTTPGDATALFIISQPGNYYLTDNITGVATKHGIMITTSNVTLDLNGFHLIGVAGSLSGVSDQNVGGKTNLIIRNGLVRDWGGNGVFIANTGNSVIEGIVVHNNGENGLSCGITSTVSHCTAQSNNLIGIYVENGSVVTNCSAAGNLEGGIFASAGSTISHCAARGNTVFGLQCGVGGLISESSADNHGHSNDIGILLAQQSMAVNCTVRNTFGTGIKTANLCTVRDCTVTGSKDYGIRAGTSCLIEGNNVTGGEVSGIEVASQSVVKNCAVTSVTGDGINASTKCLIEGNHVSVGGLTADGQGINVSENSTIRSCSVTNFAGEGIKAAGNGCTVMDSSVAFVSIGIEILDKGTVKNCTVTDCNNDGIRAGSNCLIEGNNVTDGEEDGIEVSGANNRIDSNNVSEHAGVGAAGIRLPGTSSNSVIVRNTCRGNTTGLIITGGVGHFTGPFVTTSADADFTHPWANFTNP